MLEISSSLSLQQLRQIDTLCDQFESDWQQQRRPRIEDYLERIEESFRPALRQELLLIELEWRLHVGEQPSLDEYATRCPALAGVLRDFLAAAQQAFAARNAATALDTGMPPKGAEMPETVTTQDFVSPTPAAQETVRRVGEYDLIEPLGEGGMGQVWKARHRRLGKLVALKLIRPSHEYSAATVQRFLREMKAIGELDHPHVVEASDAGESDGTVYLAMKLIDGTDLAKYVRQCGPLPIREACDLARQMALGLQYLHERGLVHRDLKPGNLIRTPDGTIKILDLGLARWQADEPSEEKEYTQPGQGMGTPDYMAPEQVSQAATADIRADLYALGATLFHLLTGQPPFANVRGAFEKMKAHESTRPADVRKLRPEVPAGLAALVARLLAKRPADRPATPAEVADALTPCTSSEPVMHRSIILAPSAQRRRLVGLGVGAVAALLVVAGTLVLTLGPGWQKRTAVIDKEPAIPDEPRRAARVRPLSVLKFDVAHAERMDKEANEKGVFGIESFSARFGDQAKVSVKVSRPAYGYLIAYAADGKEFLLDPPPGNSKQPPAQTERLEYPPVGVHEEYAFNDGVGLHVFVAVFSSEPLPAYAEWQKKHGLAPWGPGVAGRPGAVWRRVGGDLHAATAASPDVRGPGAVELGVAPVEKLVDWWQKQPGIVEVGLTGFAVTKAE